MPEENCENCKFFKNRFCRRYPPKIILDQTHGDGYQNGYVNYSYIEQYPCVSIHDLCGEYQLNPNINLENNNLNW